MFFQGRHRFILTHSIPPSTTLQGVESFLVQSTLFKVIVSGVEHYYLEWSVVHSTPFNLNFGN